MHEPPPRPPQAPRELILASTSPYRRELLARLGVPFRCVPPQVDEAPYKRLGLPPRQLSVELAQAKATDVGRRHPAAVVIGSDQVAHLDGETLDKPGDAPSARAQLARLAGRAHELATSVSVWTSDLLWTHTDVALLTMRPLAPDEIERYLAADTPLDCVGSYKLEQRGIALFESIASADHTAITGLPLVALTTKLRALGFAIP